MNDGLAELIWRGIRLSNPWWDTGRVPDSRLESFRRHAFDVVLGGLLSADVGRGLVLLGPRRVGKTVLLHQIVQALLSDGIAPSRICLLSLDDVALRDRDLGELLDLVEVRRPLDPPAPRFLLLDEVQHSPSWAGWLKRISDRRDPYVFLATGSSATALRRGGQDAGVGRWREMTLFPWSFREHVQLRGLRSWSFDALDDVARWLSGEDHPRGGGPMPPDETARLENALVDYLLRGGFPEAARATDLVEARRRVRQDILDRALGRDVLDVTSADPRTLERLFLKVCLNPGGQWNESLVSRDLGVSRETVSRYLQLLEQAFLAFRLPNLASPIRGQPKVYLVAPALRPALLGLDDDAVRAPAEWGVLAENAVASVMVGSRPDATSIGFWRDKTHECDVVALRPGGGEFVEVKRSGAKGVGGISTAMGALGGGSGWILARDASWNEVTRQPRILRCPLAAWLYLQTAEAGGTLRMTVR